MGRTLAETICEITRRHLTENGGLLFGQCVTAVGWVGGTIPKLTEAEGIRELSMADVAGAGIAVGAALSGRRPIYVIRYQGFMWYNAAPIVNYAAKSKAMWNVPCPIFVRSLAMEGGIGPVATGSHHSMVARMPGIPICAPMTPREYEGVWSHFMAHDDPLYVSEHRKSFAVDYDMPDEIASEPRITLFAISGGRLNAREAVSVLAERGIRCDLFHVLWIKPFEVTPAMRRSLARTRLGLVVDSDFEVGGVVRSVAYDLMMASGAPVHAMGLEDRTAGFAARFDNITPTAARVAAKAEELIQSVKNAGGGTA